jgi:uncharacterized protein YdaU (DUF1376 family)
MHYYPFNIGDYRRQTNHLTLLEHGIYRSLIDTYYLDERPLCADHAKLMRSHCVRTEEEKQAFLNVLEDFFVKQSDGYHHKACDEYIEKYRAKREKAKASAEARWSKTVKKQPKTCERNANASKSNANASKNDANGMLTNNQEPITNNQDLKDTKVSCRRNADVCVELHAAYCKIMNKSPNRIKLSDSRRKLINKALKDYPVEDIVQAFEGCAQSKFHQGKNATGVKYDQMELILRDAKHIESFRDMMDDSETTKLTGWEDATSRQIGV